MILICIWVIFYFSWWVTIIYCGVRQDWALYTRICHYFLLSLYFFVYFSWFFEGQWYLSFPDGGIV